MIVNKPVAQRFWEKVKKAGPDECWEWLACKDKDGYGRFKYKGKITKAHRMVWMLTFGEIPKDQCVLHHCDNPGCVNPDHLYVGIHVDNMRDMVERGRANKAKGLKNSNGKYSFDLVQKVRKEYEEGVSQCALSRKYGVDHTWIHLVVRNKTRQTA